MNFNQINRDMFTIYRARASALARVSRTILPAFYALLILILLAINGHCAETKIYPQRIVSLGPINTENVFLLGAGDRLVGNTDYCVRPEAAQHKSKVGSVMQVSMEKIVNLQPDLVLATALTRQGSINQLRAMGINVVRFKQPESFLEICSQFIQLGELLGLKSQAQRIISQTKDQVEKLQKSIAHLPRQKVFLQVGSTPLFSSVESSFTHDFIRMAGGKNIAAGLHSGKINYERVIAHDPDVIIVALMGSENGIAAKEKENWLRFKVISAVKKNRVHIVSPDLVCSPSPATFMQTLKIIVHLLHPESMIKDKL